MKKLQNDLTTAEQSKRLLELGVPKESANYYIDLGDGKIYIREPFDYEKISGQSFFEYYNVIFYPCWSVGRLIEIVRSYRKPDKEGRIWFDIYEEDATLIEMLIAQIEIDLEDRIADFSKLEEE